MKNFWKLLPLVLLLVAFVYNLFKDSYLQAIIVIIMIYGEFICFRLDRIIDRSIFAFKVEDVEEREEK
jgi:hypothetical protein